MNHIDALNSIAAMGTEPSDQYGFPIDWIPASELAGRYTTKPLTANVVYLEVPEDGQDVVVEAVLRGRGYVDGKTQIGPLGITHIDESGDAAIRAKARGVAMFEYSHGGKLKRCTAFLIARQVAITNNHCVRDSSFLEPPYGGRVYFDFQSDLETGEGVGVRFLSGRKDLDITLLQLTAEPTDVASRILTLDGRGGGSIAEGLSLRLIQVYEGRAKMVAFDSDCVVKSMLVAGDTASLTDFFHGCDTAKKSSGSPVVAATNGVVVGLHHKGAVRNAWDFNKAVLMALIVPYLLDEAKRYPREFIGLSVSE